MIFASNKQVTMNSPCFSWILQDAVKDFFFWSWEVENTTVQGRLLTPSEDIRIIISFKHKWETNPWIPKHPSLRLERSACLLALKY